MNIYLISQTKNKDYDSYDSAVVVAESEYEASLIHPDDGIKMRVDCKGFFMNQDKDKCRYDWVVNVKDVYAELIAENVVGVHQYARIICASFNAG